MNGIMKQVMQHIRNLERDGETVIGFSRIEFNRVSQEWFSMGHEVSLGWDCTNGVMFTLDEA